MHCRGIARIRLFDMALTLAEERKLHCFNEERIIVLEALRKSINL